jgi:hypothetical protein
MKYQIERIQHKMQTWLYPVIDFGFRIWLWSGTGWYASRDTATPLQRKLLSDLDVLESKPYYS